MSQRNEFIVCPVCKSGISNDMIIPIYSSTSKTPHPKDAMESKDQASSGKKDQVPERPRAERHDPVRNRNSSEPMFRRLTEQERTDLSQNNFLYNLSQLIAFMGSNSFSWDRVERTIYQSRRETFDTAVAQNIVNQFESSNVPQSDRKSKYQGWEFYFVLAISVLISLFLFDIW